MGFGFRRGVRARAGTADEERRSLKMRSRLRRR
eukprot:COSAG01_NODE_27470_length_685_cov_0.641638_1_plen_32_part_10